MDTVVKQLKNLLFVAESLKWIFDDYSDLSYNFNNNSIIIYALTIGDIIISYNDKDSFTIEVGVADYYCGWHKIYKSNLDELNLKNSLIELFGLNNIFPKKDIIK